MTTATVRDAGFALMEAYSDGGGMGKEGGSRRVFGFETVLRGVSG